ncbi:MAG: glycoside hydrolase [Acidobacteriaceae bacterium]|nr:glycoside hydrolase [Acidobacteriaceae bacterium]
MGLLTFASVFITSAQSIDPKLFSDMRWRNIGPYRGGRTRALAGVPSQPNVFYIGAVNGGVWKSDDYGRTWDPIFDHEPTGSVGAIAVAPDPNIVYVGSGEGLQRPDLSTGDGIYKSSDAGKTWTHLGLREGQQIAHIAVDPHDSNRLFAAVLGHPYGPNSERGVFRSTDGGQTFEKVLYKDENTGANDVEIDPANPKVVYACLWESRQGPWENAEWSGTGGGIFKSTDGGTTWNKLGKGLPADGDQVVEANLAIAPSNSNILYAAVAAKNELGIYRSDDAGATWVKTTNDERSAARIGGGDAPVPAVDPKNPDVVYTASVVTWKSVDGGKTWTGIRGAPGGDDYQSIWINPNNPQVLLIVSDQGAIVTVNGGETWSSWYNQSTAQMYHVNADNAFPYRVCSGQQESGSACVATRGNDGAITFRDWHPVGAEEYGYAVPDPLNADLVYGGKLSRYDRRTGQTTQVGPKPLRSADYRVVRTAPVVFSPVDPHILYFAGNTVWKTQNGGQNWQQISPDLTRTTWEVPASVGKYRPDAKVTRRGVVYALAPSPLDSNRIWAGTDDGLLHVTTDGGAHWTNVTPPQLSAWDKVSIIDAGHFDKDTAYAAINAFRLDDLRPHILRTHDCGKTWTESVKGIPDGAAVNVVREDPKRKGLLYAGSEREVYVSFDDGDRWQSLRLNMPATSIRDLLVKGDDLISATHGRGFWVLDDVTPLRQVSESMASSNYLFEPETAIRVRWNTNTDTPLPPDEPAGQNPPDGAILDYYLSSPAKEAVTLEIVNATGDVMRRYSSADEMRPIDPMLDIPKYWVRPPQALSAEAGMHRFVWDMHLPPLPGLGGEEEFPMTAIYRDTPPAPTSPWVMPGAYTVTLTVDGKTYKQPLTLLKDPRVQTTEEGFEQQYRMSKELYDDIKATLAAMDEMRSLREQLGAAKSKTGTSEAAAAAALDQKAAALEGKIPPKFGGGGRAPWTGPDTMNRVSGSLRTLMLMLQEADVAPTSQAQAAVRDEESKFSAVMAQWNSIKIADIPKLNAQLKAAGVQQITLH